MTKRKEELVVRTLPKVVITILVVQLTGCAAMFHGTNDQVTVVSGDPDAKLYMDSMYLGKGSGAVTVKRNTTHTIFARKKGCADGIAQTQTSFDSVSLLGLLIDWGIISMLVIDWGATGAMWKTDPLLYNVSPNCPEEANLSSPLAGPEMTAIEKARDQTKNRTVQSQEGRASRDKKMPSNCFRADRGFVCREE